MATAASSLLPQTLSLSSSSQSKPSSQALVSFSLPSKSISSFAKPLSVFAGSSCSLSPIARKIRPFELGSRTRVVLSDLEVDQGEDEEFDEGEKGLLDEDSFGEEEGEEEEESVEELSPDLKLFVGNLPFSVDSAQLAGVFADVGNVEMVEVIYDKITGRSRGFGFVTMSTTEEAAAAIQQFDGYMLEGRELRVRSGPPPPREESSGRFRNGPSADEMNRVYVGNLSWGVDNSALETLFSEEGKVLDARVIYDRESGRSRGFGFVTFSSAEEVDNAISRLNGADLDGRAIRVTMAEAKPRRGF